MPLFVILGRDGPEGAARRKLHRPAHLEHYRTLEAEHRVRFAGPLLADDGSPCGSVLVVEFPDATAARAHAARDPYVAEGVFESHEVLGTLDVFPPRS